MVQERPGRVERRLSAILAADVAGYSRRMGLDEVGTARTLREHRAVTDALVAKHGGRLVKSTGDGVLLEFPSVVDEVECAVAVQAVMDQRNEGVPADRRMLFVCLHIKSGSPKPLKILAAKPNERGAVDFMNGAIGAL
jgi:class 3 adenylate cyclase